MHDLSNRYISHLLNRKSESEAPKIVLTEKDIYVIQYVSGHVVQKIYRKLRKSKHWEKDEFQQCIQLLKSMKIDKTETYKLVYSKDRGGLWYVSMDIVLLLKQAELQFLKNTAGHVTKIAYKSLVGVLMKNVIVKEYWRKILDDSLISVNPDVGKDLLEQVFGLYLRVRGFSYAKNITEKHKLQNKKGKKRSLRNELKKADDDL